MRKLYNRYFYIPKHEKITEKVMLTRVAITVMIVVMCLAAMSITAYAYFSCNISSGVNVIKGANFEADVLVNEINNGEKTEVKTTVVDSNTHTAELQANKTYEITFSHKGSAETGFYVISALNSEQKYYHTKQLLKKDSNNQNGSDTFTFNLEVNEDTVITIDAHWGTSSYYSNFENNSDEYITDENKSISIGTMMENKESSDSTSDEDDTESNEILSVQENEASLTDTTQ